MRKYTFKLFFTISVLCVLTNSAFGQRIDHDHTAADNLRMLVENASRSQQVVWVEDFTGLN